MPSTSAEKNVVSCEGIFFCPVQKVEGTTFRLLSIHAEGDTSLIFKIADKTSRNYQVYLLTNEHALDFSDCYCEP